MEGQRIAVWFSCGVPSAVAAKLTIERFGAANEVRIVNNPVAEEDADNRRFAKEVQDWLGYPIEEARNPKYPSASAVDVWADRRFMSSPHGAPCTGELKKVPRQLWEQGHKPDWHVLGFTLEEAHRHAKFILSERPNVLPVLIDARMTRAKCFEYFGPSGIAIPRTYLRGYPNANCIGCVKASSPEYWNHVREMDPDVFAARATQSRDIGAKLVRVRNERIFLDELKPTDRGRPMKQMNVDCGIFCEEPA